MTNTELLTRADVLRHGRTPFVLATVVRAERPTSAKAGDRALVLPDGTLEGFVGGTCAETTVRLQGLRLLETGESPLLRITPDRGHRDRRRAGAGRRPGHGGQPVPVRRDARHLPGGHPPPDAGARLRRRPHRPRSARRRSCARPRHPTSLARGAAAARSGRRRRRLARPRRGDRADRGRTRRDAVRRAGGQSEARRGGARRAGSHRGTTRARPHPGRPGHRRADPGGDRALGLRRDHRTAGRRRARAVRPGADSASAAGRGRGRRSRCAA